MCDQTQSWRYGTVYLVDFQGSQTPTSHRLLSMQGLGSPGLLRSVCHLQFNLAKDTAKALHKVHGTEYTFGSISTTLCE